MEVGAADPRVVRLISIGTPVGKYDFSFLSSCRKPILFVHGERDEFGSPEELRGIIEQIPEGTEKKLVLVPDADHFFNEHLEQLKKAISDWITPVA